MTGWVGLFIALIGLINVSFNWARERGLIKQGEANAIADAMRKGAAKIEAANAARARSEHDSDHGGLLEDDGNRRPD